MKIVEIKKLSKIKFPNRQNMVAKDDAEAIEWAKKHRADTLYKYVRSGGALYIVEEK